MLLQPCDGMSFISIKAYVTCLIKSSCCSCMKIEKRIPYLFFFLHFEMYKNMKFISDDIQYHAKQETGHNGAMTSIQDH